MTANDIILLDQVLSQKKGELVVSLSDSDFFELFAFEQILKKYDLTYDELLDGKTGAGGDGGIDGFFTLIDGELIREDTGYSDTRRDVVIELFLIQTKHSDSFSEIVFDRVNSTVANLFNNLESDLSEFQSIYNIDIIEKATLFRDGYVQSAAKHPSLRIYFFYVNKGDTATIHPNVQNRADILKRTLESYFPGSQVKTVFLGAREILDLSRIEKSYTLKLRFLENYISRGEDNYIILSSLEDYYKFVSDEDNNLRCGWSFPCCHFRFSN